MKYKIPIDDRKLVKGVKNQDYVDFDKLAEMTDGMSGADVASVVNLSVSQVVHKFLDKNPSVEEVKEKIESAYITMQDFTDAVKKVREQKNLKIGEKLVASYYR
ncbi:hypothetical protein [Nitrosarchaeum sp.]|uniref:hypothetical protein n=1 Tax=Nitrosarchaeum sp. TaxID=2026886 RepID=UPI003FA52E41